MKPTYTLETGPCHIPDDEYFDNTQHRYVELISQQIPERTIQRFLEKHPVLVPGHSSTGSSSMLYPLDCALISQPELPGLSTYRPDFMWISTHSMAWYPTLIEIEAPHKRYFTKKGLPTADFSQARFQLAQWRTWFKDSGNVQQFKSRYRIPDHVRSRTMQLHMILVYGRRAEFEDRYDLTSQIAELLPGHDEELMSFDRLKADPTVRDAITVRSVAPADYEALWIPEIFETRAELASRLLHIKGIPETIDRNPKFGHSRSEFLKRRIAYWKNWAKSGSSVLRYGDGE